jgi:hypothetical protein
LLAGANKNIYLVKPKSNTLKLTELLATYLSINKELPLQGIGIFTLDTSYTIEEEPGRSGQKQTSPGTISFKKDLTIKTDDKLISYLSEQTGKMKALAASDLDSYTEQAKEFINIGKPYLFEGIGTIIKNKDGHYSFTQGDYFIEKIEDKIYQSTAVAESKPTDFKSVILKQPEKINWRKPLIALFILLGLGLVVGGGYLLYKRTSQSDTVTETIQSKPAEPTGTLVSKDSTADKNDSALTTRTAIKQQAVNASSYKFVIDQFKAPRAFTRFYQLKNFGWPIQIETKDSVSYKLFVLLPVSGTDTTRALDSLTALNGRRVFIEHHN